MDGTNKKRGGSKNLLGSLISALIFFSPSFANAEVVDRIAAEVNGEIILQSEVNERVFQMKAGGMLPNRPQDEIKADVLNGMIEEKLIIQFGKEKEIKVENKQIEDMLFSTRSKMQMTNSEFAKLLKREGLSIERYREILHDQILAQKVLAMEVRSQVQIAEEAIEDYYKENESEFQVPPTVKARHILLMLKPDSPPSMEMEVLSKLKTIREEILAGLDFAEAAKKYSEGPSASDGGSLGVVKPGEMVKPFEEAAFALKTNEISEPVRTRFGYHLILVEERTAASKSKFEEVKKDVENKMFRRIMAEIKSEWIGRLKKNAFIDIKAN